MLSSRQHSPAYLSWEEKRRQENDYISIIERECEAMQPPYVGYCYTNTSGRLGRVTIFLGAVIHPDTKVCVTGPGLGVAGTEGSKIMDYRNARHYNDFQRRFTISPVSKRKPKMVPYPARLLTRLEKDIVKLRKQGRLVYLVRCDENGVISRERNDDVTYY